MVGRFYNEVSVDDQGQGFAILLDGRAAKTAGRHTLTASARPLAEAIAKEWADQGDELDLTAMPLTRLQGFVLDGGDRGRAEWTDMVCQYAQSDLLCYRSPTPALAARQAEAWQPVLDRVSTLLGETFVITEGIMAVTQPEGLEPALRTYLGTLSVGALFAVKLMTEMFGSAALAVAVEQQILTVEEAFVAGRVDETYQEEQWGQDAEAAERAKNVLAEAVIVERFLTLQQA